MYINVESVFAVIFMHCTLAVQFSYRLKQKSEKSRPLIIVGKVFNRILCGKYTIKRPVEPKYFNVHVFSFEPVYRVIFTLFSALGLFVNVYFYTFCLIYVLLGNDILQDILSSVKAAG